MVVRREAPREGCQPCRTTHRGTNRCRVTHQARGCGVEVGLCLLLRLVNVPVLGVPGGGVRGRRLTSPGRYRCPPDQSSCPADHQDHGAWSGSIHS